MIYEHAGLTYDSETGLFRRKNRLISRKANAQGYLRVTFGGLTELQHRLAWYMVYGYWPKRVDHINLNRTDNRIANLRECTAAQNLANKIGARADSTTGFRGVQRTRQGRYLARICLDGEQKSLGTYDTPEQASAVYNEKLSTYYGEFARTE